MMTVAKKAVPKELLNSLLADYRQPEDLIGENGLLKQLTRLLVERALEAEMAVSAAISTILRALTASFPAKALTTP